MSTHSVCCHRQPVSSTVRRSGLGRRRGARGSAAIEFSIITFLVVVVLIAEPNVITLLLDAIKQVYGAFTSALSMTFPTPPIPTSD